MPVEGGRCRGRQGSLRFQVKFLPWLDRAETQRWSESGHSEPSGHLPNLSFLGETLLFSRIERQFGFRSDLTTNAPTSSSER